MGGQGFEYRGPRFKILGAKVQRIWGQGLDIYLPDNTSSNLEIIFPHP